mmetsp:Transcript_43231/g.100187  ORF Transcript_43231/g.100187 Transcript_43231/m.100187 type:complete len:203 (+) Transcript_43231:329-937(+)
MATDLQFMATRYDGLHPSVCCCSHPSHKATLAQACDNEAAGASKFGHGVYGAENSLRIGRLQGVVIPLCVFDAILPSPSPHGFFLSVTVRSVVFEHHGLIGHLEHHSGNAARSHGKSHRGVQICIRFANSLHGVAALANQKTGPILRAVARVRRSDYGQEVPPDRSVCVLKPPLAGHVEHLGCPGSSVQHPRDLCVGPPRIR